MAIVIVYGTPGSGKSRNADKIAEAFGMSHIVDEWNGTDKLQSGDLALTILSREKINPQGGSVYSIDHALKVIGRRPERMTDET